MFQIRKQLACQNSCKNAPEKRPVPINNQLTRVNEVMTGPGEQQITTLWVMVMVDHFCHQRARRYDSYSQTLSLAGDFARQLHGKRTVPRVSHLSTKSPGN